MSDTKYRILHQLGAGGMGTVRKGLLLGQAGFQRPIVVKQLRTPEPEHLRLFVEEARRYAVLDHENIGRIFDFERVDGELCIVLEYIDGWSLVEYLERHRGLGCLPDVELSVFIASRVCRGLQYVFEKARIVHRDVSPSNVMMTTEGTVKLIDFGIAARSGIRETYLAGKPSYMAPEMVVEMRADQRSDIFSLGTVLFEILTGDRLFTGDTTAEVLERVVAGDIPKAASINPAVPEAVEAILARALERQAGRRFVSAAAMGEACEHFLYDKGYGPTNLTLKHYLASIFGRGMENESAADAALARADAHPPPRRDAAPRGRRADARRLAAQEGDRPRGDAAAGRGQDPEEPEGLSPPRRGRGLRAEELQALDHRVADRQQRQQEAAEGGEHVVAPLGLQGVEDLRGRPAAGQPAEVGPVVDAGHDEAEEQHRQGEALRLLADHASCPRGARSGAAPR